MNRASATSHVAKVPAAAPVARRHIVQWQCVTRRGGRSASNRTAPQRHDPVTFVESSIAALTSLRGPYCADQALSEEMMWRRAVSTTRWAKTLTQVFNIGV